MQDSMTKGQPVSASRRGFLKTTGAVALAVPGLAIGFHLPAAQAAKTAAGGDPREVNAWVRIAPNGAVTLEVARAEMGQGAATGLTMLIAEELECDWKDVRVEYASASEHIARNRVFVTMATGGSRGVRDSHLYLRQAGASAREMLRMAAAQRWNVPVEECTAKLGRITHAASKRSLGYGELAEAAGKLTPPKDVKLKDPSTWTIVGKPIARVDIPEKVNGRAVFGIDVRVPGMLYAAVVQCPVFGGKPDKVETGNVTGRRGVRKVVRGDTFVAVVADNWWRAQQALKGLEITWDFGGNEKVNDASIRKFLEDGMGADLKPMRTEGDVNKAFAGAAKVVEAEYFVPFLNHATLEPQNCTALVANDGTVEIWAPTQNAEAALATAAATAGVPESKVTVHRPYLGGGFGRRGAYHDFVRQAVLIAKEMPGTPVKMLWSREEDMQHDYFRPLSLVRQRAALDSAGKLIGFEANLSSPSILAKVRPAALKNGLDFQAIDCYGDMPYEVPNIAVRHAMRNTHVPVGFWRAVFHSQNPFTRECFIDEICQASGQDPVALRRSLLAKSPKEVAVLDAVVKASNWDKPLPKGVYRGIALQDAYQSFTAAVIEISVSPKKEIKLHRVVVAVDSGYTVNPDSAVAQVQSCVFYGLSAVFSGEINIRDGRVVQTNFTDYPVMQMRHSPKIEAVLVPSGGFFGGLGEPPLAPLAPALVNAIAAATGERVRSLPLARHGYTLA